MKKIKTLFVTGYRSFELGVFQEKDPKISLIKKIIKQEIINYLENGLEWVLIGGNLGIEIWTSETISELKMIYPELKLGILYPFQGFGENWNEGNQNKLKEVEQYADYINFVSHQPYKSGQQLKNHTKFILSHSEGCLLIYDKEYPGKSLFFLEEAEHFLQDNSYDVRVITMEDLQNYFEYSESV